MEREKIEDAGESNSPSISLINSKANLVTATSDDSLKEIFRQIKESKNPTVINYGASCLVFDEMLERRSFVVYPVPPPSSFICTVNPVSPSKIRDCVVSVVRCGACSQILPAFCQLSSKFPKQTFVYADIDECPETTQHIRYTPTFHFYRGGERVDEMFGTGEERLHDRLWLHS